MQPTSQPTNQPTIKHAHQYTTQSIKQGITQEKNKQSKEFVEDRTGATEKILQLIERDRLL